MQKTNTKTNTLIYSKTKTNSNEKRRTKIMSKKTMEDLTCLAEGLTAPADSEKTGLNLNEIVTGPTGSGKSWSNAYSRLLHTFNSSVVVPITKRAIKDKFLKLFEDRGYEVIDIDYAHPELGNSGYNPLDYLHSDEDVLRFAETIMKSDAEKVTAYDPYWTNAAISMHAAEIHLTMLKAKEKGTTPTYADVLKLHHSMEVEYSSSFAKTNLDKQFELAEKKHPGNRATALWRTVTKLPNKTASCVFSTVNGYIDKISSDNIYKITQKSKRISFEDLGNKKVALFITTPPTNKVLQNFVNIMYSDMIRILCDQAEMSEDNRLKVPVHILCDDFACGSRIKDFEDYISIFRAAGISVTILLQSETQLINMYGEAAALTIINNCDTYVYMGGMDIATCRNIAQRANEPLDKVMSMPLEEVIVFRRGSRPYQHHRRYQILEDPLYKEVFSEDEKTPIVIDSREE